VSSLLDVGLEIEGSVTEGTQCLGARPDKILAEVIGIPHDRHSTSTTAGRRFEQERVCVQVLGRPDRVFDAGQPRRSLARGNTNGLGHRACLKLVARATHDLSRRPDERNSVFFAGINKSRPFGKKPIARVECIAVRVTRGCNDPFNGEVAFPRCWRSNDDDAVCEFGAERIDVSRRDGEDTLDIFIETSLDNTNGNFTAIGNQNTAHGVSSR